MMLHHPYVTLFACVALFFACPASCQCDLYNPSKNCLTLWKAFSDSLINYSENLYRLDFVFDPPSRITPTIVEANYSYSLNGIDEKCNLTCSDNCTATLGWTSQSLYVYIHSWIINQLRYQMPFLVIATLEGSNIRQEPNVDDFLWVGGDITLPVVHLTLNVTLSPEEFTGCPTDEEISNALAEMNEWLLAHARVAHDSGGIKKTDPGLKGHTLQQSAVNPPRSFVNTNDSDELMIGQIIFGIMYSINALISLSLSIMLLPTVLEKYDKKMIHQEGKFFEEDPVRVQWLTAALLAGAYLFAVFVTDIYFLSVNVKSFNLFILLKLLFSVVPLFFVVILSICYCCKNHTKCYTAFSKCGIVVKKCGTAFIKCDTTFFNCDTTAIAFIHFRKITLVGTVWLAIYLLSLSIVPTVLLLCAYPMNTFALIVIHVALIYTETKVGTLVFMQLHKMNCMCCESRTTNVKDATPNSQNCCTLISSVLTTREAESRDETNNFQSTNRNEQNVSLLTNRRACCRCCSYKPKRVYVCQLISMGIMFVVLVGVYFSFIWFYQFILLRSVNSNVAFDIILKYVPSAVIGLFGFFISTYYNKHRENDGSNQPQN